MLANPKQTILVVDDEVGVCTLLQHALAGVGYHVLIAHDGQEALTQYQTYANPVTALITDLQMPVMGGLDLARAMICAQPDLAIVFMSGDPQGTELPTALEFPRHAFLAKPFVPAACLGRLSALLGP